MFVCWHEPHAQKGACTQGRAKEHAKRRTTRAKERVYAAGRRRRPPPQAAAAAGFLARSFARPCVHAPFCACGACVRALLRVLCVFGITLLAIMLANYLSIYLSIYLYVLHLSSPHLCKKNRKLFFGLKIYLFIMMCTNAGRQKSKKVRK